MVVGPYTLGVLHPPGYPLYTLIGKLFTYLPFSNFAFRMNIMAMLFSILALVIYFRTLSIIFKNETAAALSVLILAFSPLYWEYSIVAEVFGLNNLIVSLMFYIIIKWGETRDNRLLYLFSFVFGLGFAHHQTVLFLMPAFFYFIISSIKQKTSFVITIFAIFGGIFFLMVSTNSTLMHPMVVFAVLGTVMYALMELNLGLKTYGFMILSVFAGLLPYTVLPLLASMHPPLNWDDPTTLSRWIHLILRKDYPEAGFLPENIFDWKYGQLSLILKSTFRQFFIGDTLKLGTINPFIGILWGIAGSVITMTGIYGIYTILFGKEKNSKRILMIAAYLSGAVLFVTFLGITKDNVVLHVIQRLYIVSFIIFTSFICAGLTELLELLKEKKAKTLLISVTAVLMLALLSINYKRIDKSENFLLFDFCSNMIRYPDKAPVMIVSGDTLSMGIDYLQMVDKRRPQNIVLDQEKMTYKWYVEQIRYRYPDFVVPFEYYDGYRSLIKHLVDANFDKRTFYVTGPKDKSLEGNYTMLGSGLLRVLLHKDVKIDIKEVIKKNDHLWGNFSLRRLKKEYYDKHSFEEEVVGIYAKARFNQAWAYDFYKDYDSAEKEYYKAIEVDPDFHSPYKNLGIMYVNSVRRFDKAIQAWEKYIALEPNDPEIGVIKQETEKLKMMMAQNPQLKNPLNLK
jgi:tetratricopeptide (TPR) repeat protein